MVISIKFFEFKTQKSRLFLAYQKLNPSCEQWKMFSDKLVNDLCWPKTGIQICLIIFVGRLCKKHPIISHFVIACVWQELQKSWSKVCTCTMWWNNFWRSILNRIFNFVSMVMPPIFTLLKSECIVLFIAYAKTNVSQRFS